MSILRVYIFCACMQTYTHTTVSFKAKYWGLQPHIISLWFLGSSACFSLGQPVKPSHPYTPRRSKVTLTDPRRRLFLLRVLRGDPVVGLRPHVSDRLPSDVAAPRCPVRGLPARLLRLLHRSVATSSKAQQNNLNLFIWFVFYFIVFR